MELGREERRHAYRYPFFAGVLQADQRPNVEVQGIEPWSFVVFSCILRAYPQPYLRLFQARVVVDSSSS